MNSFQKLIKEICDEKDIGFELLSKDWIIKLSKDDKTSYIVGNRFPINGYSIATICNDKYATYDVLRQEGIPIVEHKLMYSKRIKNYSSDLRVKKDIVNYIKKYGEIVIKDACGSEGKDVYRANTYMKAKKYLNRIFKRKNTAVICPFMNIEAEYRVICLNDHVEVIFSKERQNGEWKHNLCNGATAKIITDEKDKNELSEFALKVAKAIGINFASVDLIKVDGKIMVLEINSSVVMNKFMEQSDYGREIAKGIYAKAISRII